MMLTILYIVIISILLVFLVSGFLIWRKFNPIIRKMMENLEKMGKTTPKTTIYNNNYEMRRQIKEIQDYIRSKTKK
jgi:nitrate/TMAO reductase-like tetraheme cytochrome c subunit